MKQPRLLLDDVNRQRLVKARKQAGLKQTEVGKACGVSQVMVSQVESGKRQPSLDLLDRWAEHLGLKLSINLRRPSGEA